VAANLALFDFDGTITTVGTYPYFLRYAVHGPRRVLGGALLSPLILGYKVGVVSDPTIRPILSMASFRGRRCAEVETLGAAFARSVLPGFTQKHALERIAWHQRQGDSVAVVSASLDVYLHPWCREIGVDVICTTLERSEGRFTGRYVQGDCCSDEKARRVRERFDLSRYSTVYAYGDSDEDHAMLELADERYLRWARVA